MYPTWYDPRWSAKLATEQAIRQVAEGYCTGQTWDERAANVERTVQHELLRLAQPGGVFPGEGR